MAERDVAHDDATPVGRQGDRIPGRRRLEDGARTFEVGARVRQSLQLAGHRASDVRRLPGVLVHHEDGANRQPRAGVVHRDADPADEQRPGQGGAGEVDHAPLPLGQRDDLGERLERGTHALAQQRARGLLQAQAQQGAHVAEEIGHARRIAALEIHLSRGQAHQRLVEARAEHREQQVAGEGREAEAGRKQCQRPQRAHEVDDALQVDELVLCEVVQGARGLAGALLHLAGVVALVPAERGLREPRVEHVAQRFAHAHANRALEHAAGPVQHPAAHVRAEHARHPAQRVGQHPWAAPLQRIDGLGGAPGHAQLDQLRSHQQQHRADERQSRAGSMAPHVAVEPVVDGIADRGRGGGTGVRRRVHRHEAYNDARTTPVDTIGPAGPSGFLDERGRRPVDRRIRRS